MRRALPDHVRIFSLVGARHTLRHVRRITASCREEMEHLWKELGPSTDPDRLHAFFIRMNRVRDRWYASMKSLGLWPRKLWEVDFPGDDGCFYSWKSGEEAQLSLHREPDARYPRRSRVPGPREHRARGE